MPRAYPDPTFPNHPGGPVDQGAELRDVDPVVVGLEQVAVVRRRFL